jgi:hypothetical protein
LLQIFSVLRICTVRITNLINQVLVFLNDGNEFVLFQIEQV